MATFSADNAINKDKDDWLTTCLQFFLLGTWHANIYLQVKYISTVFVLVKKIISHDSSFSSSIVVIVAAF